MNTTVLDAYVPTRTIDSLELRLRSGIAGPIEIQSEDLSVTLDAPAFSYDGICFYRHTFRGLAPNTRYAFQISAPQTGDGTVVEATTLTRPPGQRKLSIGVMSDIHLPPTPGELRQYRPGTKRLTGLAGELAHRYIRRLERLGADLIVLPGDLVEPVTDRTLTALKRILAEVSIPCYPIIGNHEPWSGGGEARFYEALGLPPEGYYTVSRNGVRLLMLSTPDPAALSSHSTQRRWLEAELEKAGTEEVVLVSHFSLLLHPCVAGPRNDGYQLLDDHRQLLGLLARYPSVRLFIAGHKNVPSVVKRDGVIHTLSPQLIQFPCGYDLFHLYEGGVSRTTFEIDEQHYVEVARAAYAHNWRSRYGDDIGRNFSIEY